jgi:signal peptidase II
VIFYCVALLSALLDQLCKWAVLHHVPTGPVLGDFLRITLTHNTGAAFGLFPGARTAFVVASLVAAAGLVYAHHVLPPADRARRLPMALILGGSLGNLVDRLRLGQVTDFLDVGLGELRWPTFNLADVAVVAGALSLALALGAGRMARRGLAAPVPGDGRGGGSLDAR